MKFPLVMAVAGFLAAAPLSAPALGSDPAPRSPAEQPSVRLHDARGDTWSYTDISGYVPAVQPAADVVRARIIHAGYAVGVRMVFDDLQRAGTQWYRVEIQTPAATSWFVVEARSRHYRGTAYQDVDGEWVRVPGLSHAIDYAAEVMTFRVRRTVLGNPAWVRVRLRYDLGLPDGTFFTDNPMNQRPRSVFTSRIPKPPAADPRGFSS